VATSAVLQYGQVAVSLGSVVPQCRHSWIRSLRRVPKNNCSIDRFIGLAGEAVDQWVGARCPTFGGRSRGVRSYLHTVEAPRPMRALGHRLLHCSRATIQARSLHRRLSGCSMLSLLIRQAQCVCACTRAGADKTECGGTALLKLSNSHRGRVIEPALLKSSSETAVR